MGEVSSAVEVIRSQLEIVGGGCDALSHRELVGLLSELTSVMWSVPAIQHRALGRLLAETEPFRLGDASWPKVLTTALRVSPKEAKRQLREARSLGPRQAMSGETLAPLWEATAAAQAKGLLGPEHVAVIAKFHKNLPSWVDVGTRETADKQLAELGSGLGPEQLEKVADRLAAMIDQDGPEPCEKERARKRGITLGPQQADGSRSINGRLDAEASSYLEAIFAKEAAPGANIPGEQPPGSDEQPPGCGECPAESESPGGGEEATREQARSDSRTQAQRNHDALKAVGRSVLASGTLGSHQGLPVTVIVSTTLQDLEKAAGVAVTGGGSVLPIRDLIRMAAPARHYLYVYDKHTGASLYLGRSKRLASAAQRIVLHARERGCTRPGCTAPGYWTQAHHAVTDWKDGGHTDIDDLTLACGPDHRMLDKTGWRTRKNAQGRTEWIPPPDLDTGQHRINNYHHPERYLLPDYPPDDELLPDDEDP